MKTLAIQSTHRIYFVTVYLILAIFMVFVAFYIVQDFWRHLFFAVACYSGLTIALVKWSKRIKQMPLVKSLKYDKGNFYIEMKEMEIIIPMEDTNGIGALTLDGIFELELINQSQLGDKILFKPSLFYPLNFNKIDSEIAQINAQIKKLKRTKKNEIDSGRSLQSFN